MLRRLPKHYTPIPTFPLKGKGDFLISSPWNGEGDLLFPSPFTGEGKGGG